MNGKQISGRMLAVDPYSSQQQVTLHYLINKNDIIGMASGVPQGDSAMTFTLAPSTGQNMQTTGEILTDTGNINVALDWSPDQLNANTESTLTLGFLDGFSGNRIADNVNYNIGVLDNNGLKCITRPALWQKAELILRRLIFRQTRITAWRFKSQALQRMDSL